MSVVTEREPSGVPNDEPGVVSEDSPVAANAFGPWYRRRVVLGGVALLVAGLVAGLVLTTGRPDHSTATDSLAVEALPAKPPGQNETIRKYINDTGITSVPVKLGDPGAPNIVIALPKGWSDLGDDTPEWVYGAVQLDTAADVNDPPTIVVLLSKLTGDVDPTVILEYAPGELRNLPKYEPAAGPITDKLSGFDAIQLAGFYEKDGKKRTIAQKTVVIPANDAVYVLQMNADALKSDAAALMQATDVIDKQTKVTP